MFLKTLTLFSIFAFALSTTTVPQGFPDNWKGDRFYKSECEIVQKPPSWVDGYFFCQLSASYGDASKEEGQHVDHMFDAIGGIAVFDMTPEKTTYTGAYYPSRSYKIWNFYDRDFAQSSVAWRPAYAKMNETQAKLWEKILPTWNAPPPNVDFWKIKNNIIAGTEYYSVGFTFDIDTVDNFHYYPFKEATPLMSGQPLIPIHMPIHERMDPDTGLLWAAVSAVNISSRPPTLHQTVFSVDEDGTRKVEGVFDYSPIDLSKCGPDGFYQYDSKIDFFPRNMHSITSTENYVILPLTSVVFNPCILLKGPSGAVPFGEIYKFDQSTQVAFLVFDKREKKFLPDVLKFDAKPQFISHQLNAFEISDRVLVADMITYEGVDAYGALSRKVLTTSTGLPMAHAYRFTLDLDKKTVTAKSFLPNDPCDIEFPQFNHNFEGKPYKYGYAITETYMAGNRIIKIDTSDPSGSKNLLFTPKNSESISLQEPYFVQKPGTTGEDDGVLVARGFDTTINKTRVYVLDAKNLDLIGEILAPTDTPFGFHERFYLKESFSDKKVGKKEKSEL